MLCLGEQSLSDALSISLTNPTKTNRELKEEFFENSRYQTREPGAVKKPKPVRKIATPEVDPVSKAQSEAEVNEPVLSELQPVGIVNPGADQSPPQGFSGVLLGGDLAQVRDFRKSLDDRDLRKNWLEISFAPRWVNSQSASVYWSREAQSKLLGFFVEGRFWISPLFGLVLDYGGTLSGTLQDRYGSDEASVLKQEWLGFGFRSRRFFGSQKKISSVAWGLDLRQREQRMVSGTSDKLNTRSRAIYLSGEGRLPLNARWAMTVQVGLAPWVDHLETGGLAGDRSGVEGTATGYSLGLGLEYLFDRGNRLFFRTKADMESNQFQGGTGLADPRTGQVARGVAVSQTFLLFEIGYTWGP